MHTVCIQEYLCIIFLALFVRGVCTSACVWRVQLTNKIAALQGQYHITVQYSKREPANLKKVGGHYAGTVFLVFAQKTVYYFIISIRRSK